MQIKQQIFLVLFECFMRVYASKNTQISFNLFHNWYVVLFVLPENLVTILQQSTQLSITIIKKCAPSPIKLTGIDRPILLIIRSLYTDYVSLSILFFFRLHRHILFTLPERFIYVSWPSRQSPLDPMQTRSRSSYQS